MAKPYIHARSSVKRWGGDEYDYIEIHKAIDLSKAAFPDVRHRAMTHNSWFISTIIPMIFGDILVNSDGKTVSTVDVAEQHVLEDFQMKFIPTPQDFLQEMDLKMWMSNGVVDRPMSHFVVEHE